MHTPQSPSHFVLREALEILQSVEFAPAAPMRDVLALLTDLLTRRASLVERIWEACSSRDLATRALLLGQLEPALAELETTLASVTSDARKLLRRSA